MNRAVKVQGIECPIIREGDDIVNIVVKSVLEEIDDVHYGYLLENKSVIGITESVVARAAGQYITVDDIAADIEKKFGKDATIALINPIYSRNRFSLILKSIARAAKKVVIVMPEYDEVSNPRGVNLFTGVNIEEYYKKLCESENCECYIKTYDSRHQDNIPEEIIKDRFIPYLFCTLRPWELSEEHINDAKKVWYEGKYSDTPRIVYTLADICSDKSPDWGVLGTNKATEEKLKLFPSKAEAQRVCDEVKAKIKEKTGKDVIVCVYGDGCFKDPVGGIWEFADPVTMPAYTDKELMEGSPQEFKLKYMIDKGIPEEGIHNLQDFKNKNGYKTNNVDAGIGTTPRIYRDLLASLMDLTSGSGDRATPVVLIQNYF